MSMFRPATRKKLKARVALAGPSGSGKTYTALRLAFGIAGPSGRVAVIDTENRSAEKYVGTVADGITWQFDVATPDRFDPAELAAMLRDAAPHYDVIVIDSLSHYWSGVGGMLERVDTAAKRTNSRDSFGAWRTEKPTERALLAALTGCASHLIVTMRTKTEYAVDKDDKGRTRVQKIGLKPEQRDGIEYEFDVVADLDLDHRMIPSKSRCPALDGGVFERPGADVARSLVAWLDDGVEAHAPQPAQPPAPAPLDLARLRAVCAERGVDFADLERELERPCGDWTPADRPAIAAALDRLAGGAK